MLVSFKQLLCTQSKEKWIPDYTLENDELIDSKAAYLLLFKYTKLIVFQFKLLHKRLAFSRKYEQRELICVLFVILKRDLLSIFSDPAGSPLIFCKHLING